MGKHRRKLFKLLVFATGACSLAIEVVAMRILSPYFGNTIYTVSSVISVVLMSLSLGYYFGGKIADKKPSEKNFFLIIFASGISTLAINIAANTVLPVISKKLTLVTGPLLTASFLFILPSFLLGMLSPYAIKLQKNREPKKGVGSISGEIFFFSTVGSIFGSLASGFILIPNFGLDEIILGIGIFLAVLGVIPLIAYGHLSWRARVAVAVFLFLSVVFTKTLKAEMGGGKILFSKNGIYEKIEVLETTHEGRPVRILLQDGNFSGAVDTETGGLVFDYTKYYRLYALFNPNPKSALFIGGGAYSVPKILAEEKPGIEIDVSEIEPILYELAQKYFFLNERSDIENHIGDGRRFLASSTKEYDLIFSDVYYSFYSIPSHFTTREFYKLAKERLSDDGVFISNIIGSLSRQSPSFLISQMRTFNSAFSNSFFFAVRSNSQLEPQNIIFVGLKKDEKLDVFKLAKESDEKILANLPGKNIELIRFNLENYKIFTDNFAPADFYTAQSLKLIDPETNTLSGDEMIATIAQLTSYGPRFFGSPGKAHAESFLEAELAALADETHTQVWQHNLAQNKSIPLKNIVARFSPEKKGRILLATHYDSKRFADKNKDGLQAVPGANDSASGVSVLIEVARFLSLSQRKPVVGVDMVLFDGEEGDIDFVDTKWSPLGSTYFSEKLDTFYPEAKPQKAIVIDMVCDKDLKIKKEPASVREAPFLVEEFWDYARSLYPNIFVDQMMDSEIQDDHTPLNQKAFIRCCSSTLTTPTFTQPAIP